MSPVLYHHLLSGTCRDSRLAPAWLPFRFFPAVVIPQSARDAAVFTAPALRGVSVSSKKSASDGCIRWIFFFLFFFLHILSLLLLLLSGDPPHCIGGKALGAFFFLIHVTFLGFHRGERIPPCGDEGAVHANIVNNLLPLALEMNSLGLPLGGGRRHFARKRGVSGDAVRSETCWVFLMPFFLFSPGRPWSTRTFAVLCVLHRRICFISVKVASCIVDFVATVVKSVEWKIGTWLFP